MTRTPRQQRAIATVDAIIEAGFISIMRHGAAGTTTKHVADLAGISVGSLYEYFANKEAIYAAMHERFLADIVTVIQPLIPIMVRLDVRSATITLLNTMEGFLQEHDQRYLQYARSTLSVELKISLDPVVKVLSELIMQYVMRHPELMQVRHLPAMSYIFIHGGIFSVLRHLSDPNPPVTFVELAEGLACMVSHYVAQELGVAAGPADQAASRSSLNQSA